MMAARAGVGYSRAIHRTEMPLFKTIGVRVRTLCGKSRVLWLAQYHEAYGDEPCGTCEAVQFRSEK